MATFSSTLRRGLPRRAGGEPWPPADAVVPEAAAAAVGALEATTEASAPPADAIPPVDAAPRADAASPMEAAPPVGTAPAAGAPTSSAPATAAGRALRRGLPRVAGGEPWPPASAGMPVIAEPQESSASPASADAGAVAPRPGPTAETSPVAVGSPSAARDVSPEATADAGGPRLRRGLPRVRGGEPWPPAPAAVPASALPAAESSVFRESPAAADSSVIGETSPITAEKKPPPVAAEVAASVPAVPRDPAAAPDAPSTASPERHTPPMTAALVPTGAPRPPIVFRPTAFAGAAARVSDDARRDAAAEPERIGPFTKAQWAGAVVVGGLGLLFGAAMVVLAVRWLLSLTFMQEFLVAYPGEYELPAGAPVGFPAWLGWQHFFNTFLIVLIIRSGLRVRNEKRPTAFWSPRGNKKRKISLALWFHQALDILWVVNGVVFVVLLFITGQWLRIVPTSWAVFPNALSAVLQYISLDWPTDNGWVNYNSVQQLAYFATVFVAAPLAIVTGVRMSGIWPKNATALNRAYPVEWARRVHFPVMLYFVLFIFVHVVLVFATGALRNLNHMYAASDEVNWTGFWIFAASMLVLAAGWVAARPLVIAPIAGLFGTVKGR
ncbi:cytochrome b/b6 domain-containing protein [Microbacterium sp. P02]|uniref:cytochrome b/b6 domain-containing protein n=1 Tax=Microbacterium sp. P02 TaxID=3366260 RepID=UPI003671C6BA